MFEEFKQYLGPARPCLICNDDPEATKRTLWARDEYFKAVKCKKCGLVTVDPSLTPEGLNTYYENNIQRRFDDDKKINEQGGRTEGKECPDDAAATKIMCGDWEVMRLFSTPGR